MMMLPVEFAGALMRFRDEGIPTGGFLRAVLANDLVEAFRAADDRSLRYMHVIVGFLYNKFPARSYGVCWGSYEIVDAWIAKCAGERLQNVLAPRAIKHPEESDEEFCLRIAKNDPNV